MISESDRNPVALAAAPVLFVPAGLAALDFDIRFALGGSHFDFC